MAVRGCRVAKRKNQSHRSAPFAIEGLYGGVDHASRALQGHRTTERANSIAAPGPEGYGGHSITAAVLQRLRAPTTDTGKGPAPQSSIPKAFGWLASALRPADLGALGRRLYAGAPCDMRVLRC